MATAIIMPRQGQSVESCIIGQWHKQAGDTVEIGDVLFTYETDKATFDETAKVAGTVLGLFFEEGDDVPCLLNVCVIGTPGEEWESFNPNQNEDTSLSDSAAPAPTEPTSLTPTTLKEEILVDSTFLSTQAPLDGSTLAISPRAKHFASKSGANLQFVQPSGPNGRVIERDIQKLIDHNMLLTGAAQSHPASLDLGIQGTGIGGRIGLSDLSKEISVPLTATGIDTTPILSRDPLASTTKKHSNIRKLIAKSMQQSLTQMAQLTLHSSFDASDILEFRQKLKKANGTGLNQASGFPLAEQIPTINDIILYTVARVLRRHPDCNAHYSDEGMTYFSSVNLGVAVDTPRGLMVPTILGANDLSLNQLGQSIKSKVAQCQEGTINPDDLKNGTFTVTNLGTLGIEMFTPVINPPQTCILGVNTITTKVKDINGEIKPYSSMGLSLTFDHRALDGAPAARFLKDLVTALENFSLLLIQEA